MPISSKKVVPVVIGFSVSLAVFIMLRVVGVLYFEDLFIDILNFSPFSALNFLVWVGIIVALVVAVAVLNLMIDADKIKLNVDIIVSGVLTFLTIIVISYNYVGYNYPELFRGVGYFEGFFLYSSYFVTVFAVYAFVDIFYIWLITIVIFHVLLFLFVSADLDEVIRVKLFARRKKKRLTRMGAKQFLTAFLLIAIISLAVFAIGELFFEQFLKIHLASIEGILVVFFVSLIDALFFVLSKKLFEREDSALIFYVVTDTILSYFFVLNVFILDPVTVLLITILQNIIEFAVSNYAVKRL